MAFLTSAPPNITSYKDPARVASTANLALLGSGSLTVDGVLLADGDRILLKNQGTGSENGIYKFTVAGGNYSLARTSDADTSAKLSPNSLVPVSQGTINADNIFQLTNNSVNLGTDSLVFVAVDSVALAALAAEVTNRTNANLLDLKIAANLSDLASVGTAKTNLSLQNVDNTSDANKPVSTAQQTALNLKANLISPVFTTPNIGSATGSISGNAATVTTNANLTGPVTSVGNATAIANSAISNAMLANAAVANLSGTNTGDNAATSLVPSQTSQADKVLATDGSTSSWQFAGLGSGGLGTGNIVLGREWPSAFTTGTNVILIGKTTTALNGCINSVIIGQAATAGASPYATIVGDGASAAHSGVAIGRNAAVGGSYSVAVGHGASGGSGAETVAIGMNASCAGSDSVAIGYGAVAQQNALAIGRDANAGAVFGMAIGRGSSYTGANSHAMGYGTAAGSGTNGVFIGYGSGLSGLSGANNTVVGADSFNGASLSTANANVIVGKGSGKAITTGSANIILGPNSAGGLTSGVGNVIIGAEAGTTGTNNAITTGTYNVAVGYAASADPTVTMATALGTNAGARANYSTALGGYSQTNGTDAIVVGYKSRAYDRSITLGGEALWDDYGGTGNFIVGTYARNQSVLNNISAFGGPAGSSAQYTVAYWGQGVCRVAGASLINFTNTVTPAYGTDQAATTGTLTIAGAISTGTGIGGDIIFSTSPAGGAGSAQNASVERARVTYDGKFQVSSVTASQILASGASKEVVSLSTATYPSLAELAYVKGVTSAVQTQLNSEATARAAAVLLAVPAQSGNTDKVLVTDGTTSSWQYAGLGSGGFGTNNVFLGTPKPAVLSSASNLVCIGVSCGDSLTSGNANTAIGNESLRYNSTGNSNSALGRYTLQNTTSSYNTAIGGGALKTNTSGANNSALGFQALYNNVTGTGNVAIGYYAGRNATASDEFYLDNKDRSINSNEKIQSLMYGTFNSTASSQTLAINAAVSIPNNLSITAVGYGLKIKEGSNARMGVATLVTGMVTVSNTSVTANTRIMLTAQNNSGTIGWLSVSARTASTSFTILSSSALDTSDVAWMLVEPA